ncbi:hypothetical protein BSV1_0461 [Borreliella finlandensis]|uniref:Uncharacterized protein n=1 Tax=Borreliella finlandensis TaxID=498741 RepID=A0A826GNE4_9SPIR|nr:hypothetical protein BSV1_0461 [Borreliella finlandensis]
MAFIELAISRSDIDLDIVITLVSISIESTSSIIEVEIIVTPSEVLIFFFAESMLAAIPADVGVPIIPIKSEVGLIRGTLKIMLAISTKLVKVPTTSVIPIIPPRGKNLINNFRSVSSPAVKSNIIEAMVEIANIFSFIK